MKKTLLFAFIFQLASASAQITITNTDFPNGGDTALVSVSADFDLDYTSTGTDYSWNYEELTMNTQRIDTFFDIDDASLTYQVVFNNGLFDPEYQADYHTHLLDFVFPETDLVPISDPVGFTKIEPDKVEAVGIGLKIGGFEVPIKNEVIDVEYELPMSYGDSWTSNSFFEIDLNPAFDGILRRYQTRNTQVDGWGEITTPNGTFEVVRTFAVLDITDSMRIPLGDEGLWVELPTPNQIIYSWWAKDLKIPVLQVVAQDVLDVETITSVEYKDRYLGDLSLAKNSTDELKIFPNPASEFVQVETGKAVDGIAIYSLNGELVKQYDLSETPDQLDLKELERGVYILKITAGSSQFSRQLVVE